MVRRHRPPYEVLYTGWMSFADLLRLKGVEEMLEVYYNSGQFSVTVAALEKQFANPFDLYDGLAEACREKGAFDVSLSRMQRLNMLRGFLSERKRNCRPRWETSCCCRTGTCGKTRNQAGMGAGSDGLEIRDSRILPQPGQAEPLSSGLRPV